MTTKRYETAILFEPELAEDARKEFLGKIAGVVAAFQGEVLKTDDWGNRKLAYPIRKKSNAFYTFIVYTGNRGVVEEVERNIKIFDGILRFLTTVHTAELKPKAPAAESVPAPPDTPAPDASGPDAPAPTAGE
jgi:small subunit ribosomal protein S6